jgi:hypothetical protein
MKKFESRLLDVRVEVVTTTFVASGRPEGVHDLGRFIETLNAFAGSRHIELAEPAVRPLYRASDQLHLGAPLLVRRDEIIFANFEGPGFARGANLPPQIDAPVLLLAPPFQIQGTVALAPGSDPAQALRTVIGGFFAVRAASVYDADGNALGEGEQIIVNGGAVQMAAPTGHHIDIAAAPHVAMADARQAPAAAASPADVEAQGRRVA